jgi:GntR family transcriptional regulator/MocR family aminotransferase
MIVPENLKLPIELLLKHSHRFVSPSIQVVLNQFIEKKYLFNHMDNVIKATIDRKLYFNQIFNNLFNEMGMKILENDTLCLQSLIKLNEGISDADFVAKLAANNISVHSYNKCFIGESNKQGLIMGHCSMPKPVIKNKLSQMFSILAR